MLASPSGQPLASLHQSAEAGDSRQARISAAPFHAPLLSSSVHKYPGVSGVPGEWPQRPEGAKPPAPPPKAAAMAGIRKKGHRSRGSPINQPVDSLSLPGSPDRRSGSGGPA